MFDELELGHGIHDLISKTKYSRFHGTRLPVDIGEMPSTLLENWCWDKDILKYLSCHFSTLKSEYSAKWLKHHPNEKTPPKTIPDELLNKIIHNRNIFRGLYHLYQLYVFPNSICATLFHVMILTRNKSTVSRFDLAVHDVASHEQLEKLNFAKLWYDLRGELESQDFSEFYTRGHDYVTFSHLMNGYDVGYYSYLW